MLRNGNDAVFWAAIYGCSYIFVFFLSKYAFLFFFFFYSMVMYLECSSCGSKHINCTMYKCTCVDLKQKQKPFKQLRRLLINIIIIVFTRHYFRFNEF